LKAQASLAPERNMRQGRFKKLNYTFGQHFPGAN